jgi:histidine triad (HIT) family protein
MDNCIFCQILDHKLPGAFVYEDEEMVAIQDLHSLAATHLLIIPRKHIDSMNQVTEEDELLLSKMLIKARELAFKKGIAESGYRLVINTGSGGGQSIFHIHLHLLGGTPSVPDLMTRGLK